MHDSQRRKFDFQKEEGEGWSVGESESGRLCNWILLHGDKKNTVIQGITQQRTLKFPHLPEQGAILRYFDVDLSAGHSNDEKYLLKCAQFTLHCLALGFSVILFNFSFSLWAQCEQARS